MTKDTERFLMLPYSFMSAAGYVKPDGEQVKLTLTEKIIYAHIRNRFEFFKSLGKEYYDTQQSIAKVCNMDVKSVGNVLRKFIKDNLTTIYKKPHGNFQKNVYVNVPPLRLWWKDKPVGKEFTDDFEYEIPKDFIVDLTDDVGYNANYESELDYSDLLEWAK